ncbi:hypothetical protein BASA81_006097 [Batrachochytrium salamandrivorans]|nr:hypothetical protein BASA81_006097 [Batrachochytrium salamandrivorans]
MELFGKLPGWVKEAHRTWDTITLLPWTLITTSTSRVLSSSPPADESKDSLKWILLQLLVVYLFYRLVAPFRSAEKNRPYYKLRTALDVWLFTALVIKSPTSNQDNDLSSMRMFVTVFAVFLAASHVALAALTIVWHVIGFLLNRLWPQLVDVLFLPTGERFNPPGIRSLVKCSLAMSLATSLVFVGCAIEAKNAAYDIAKLPLVCRPVYLAEDDGSTSTENLLHHLGYFGFLSRFSLLDSPIGLLWLSGLALFIVFYLTRRSSRLALRKRFVNSLRRGGGSFRTMMATSEQFESLIEEENLFAKLFQRSAPAKPEPDFLPMSEWYSVAIIDTAVDVLISIKLFFGRFDPRLSIKPELGSVAGTFHLGQRPQSSAKEEDDGEGEFVWDWIADTGDGGNSTYAVAKALAKPCQLISKSKEYRQLVLSSSFGAELELPRASLLVIGGDLAYPGPSFENYQRRLCIPFGDALEHPPEFKKASVSTSKLPEQDFYSGENAPPVCFCIPGNHDMYDGLSAFNRCILGRDWLGGWRLPQTTTYFTLQLPRGWFIFALDQGLGEDIDMQQFRYFKHMADRVQGKSIVVVSHEPVWLYDAYDRTESGDTRAPLLKELLHCHLRDKIALRVCGDLHNYMRYENPESGVNLVVSGGGGAFLHPTHSFPHEVQERDDCTPAAAATTTTYKLKSSFPDFATSNLLGFDNFGNGFRAQNWRFDVVGSCLYFSVVASLFPRCGIASRINLASPATTNSEFLFAYLQELCSMLVDMVSTGHLSPVCLLGALGVCISFAESQRGLGFQVCLGLWHGLMHLFCALNCMLFVQLVLEMAIADGLVGKSYYTLLETYLGGAETSLAKPVMRLVDLTEAMAVPHQMWCFSHATIAASRWETTAYYLSSFAYLYVLTADVFAMVIGVYLATCASVLNCQYNESFSSLRNADYKHFLRFKIDSAGDMHCYVLGIVKTPRDWILNANFESSTERMRKLGIDDPNDPAVSSHNAATPSKWLPSKRKDAINSTPQLVDYFLVRKQL